MKQTNTFTVKYAMFARQNMLFVKNTGIKDFLLISLFFLYGSCLMVNTYYVLPTNTASPCMALIIDYTQA